MSFYHMSVCDKLQKIVFDLASPFCYFSTALTSEGHVFPQIGGIGYGGDHPPGDMPGLVEFIDSLRVPELSHVRCVSTVPSANPNANPSFDPGPGTDPDPELGPDP